MIICSITSPEAPILILKVPTFPHLLPTPRPRSDKSRGVPKPSPFVCGIPCLGRGFRKPKSTIRTCMPGARDKSSGQGKIKASMTAMGHAARTILDHATAGMKTVSDANNKKTETGAPAPSRPRKGRPKPTRCLSSTTRRWRGAVFVQGFWGFEPSRLGL